VFITSVMGPPNNFTRISRSEQEFEQEGWDEIEKKHPGRSREQALDDILLSATSRYSSIQIIVAITLSSSDLPVDCCLPVSTGLQPPNRLQGVWEVSSS
jgi:hypothetical protein